VIWICGEWLIVPFAARARMGTLPSHFSVTPVAVVKDRFLASPLKLNAQLQIPGLVPGLLFSLKVACESHRRLSVDLAQEYAEQEPRAKDCL